MGNPAARLGVDCGAHAGPVVSGSGNVLIGGSAAARKGDKVACCIHGCASIVTSSTSVFINGVGAARMGDMTDCAACLCPPPGCSDATIAVTAPVIVVTPPVPPLTLAAAIHVEGCGFFITATGQCVILNKYDSCPCPPPPPPGASGSGDTPTGDEGDEGDEGYIIDEENPEAILTPFNPDNDSASNDNDFDANAENVDFSANNYVDDEMYGSTVTAESTLHNSQFDADYGQESVDYMEGDSSNDLYYFIGDASTNFVSKESINNKSQKDSNSEENISDYQAETDASLEQTKPDQTMPDQTMPDQTTNEFNHLADNSFPTEKGAAINGNASSNSSDYTGGNDFMLNPNEQREFEEAVGVGGQGQITVSIQPIFVAAVVISTPGIPPVMAAVPIVIAAGGSSAAGDCGGGGAIPGVVASGCCSVCIG